MGIIYKHTINNKSYIGYTKYSIEFRLIQHLKSVDKGVKSKFLNAIREHGKDNIHSEVLEECNDALMQSREKYWILEFDTYKNGLNSTMGGDGGAIRIGYKNSEEQRLKSSIAQKGKPKKNKGMCGKYKKSADHKEKLAISNTGKIWVSNLENMVETQIIKEDTQKYLDDGYVIGRKVTDFSTHKKNPERTIEQRKKLSDAIKGRICIYNKETRICKMIYEHEFDKYKQLNYVRGRK